MAEGLSVAEREAVKQRAKELRAQEKAGKDREAGTKAVREAIEKLEGDDRASAEGMYRVVTEVAPHLVPKTYYGMPGFANDAGKIVLFLRPSSKFKERYSTIGFEPASALDDGDVWPVAYAVPAWTDAVAQLITERVKLAAS